MTFKTLWSVFSYFGHSSRIFIEYPFFFSPIQNHLAESHTANTELKDEFPRSVGAQYATGDQWRNNSRKNEETEPKQKQHTVVDVTDGGSKV